MCSPHGRSSAGTPACGVMAKPAAFCHHCSLSTRTNACLAEAASVLADPRCAVPGGTPAGNNVNVTRGLSSARNVCDDLRASNAFARAPLGTQLRIAQLALPLTGCRATRPRPVALTRCAHASACAKHAPGVPPGAVCRRRPARLYAPCALAPARARARDTSQVCALARADLWSCHSTLLVTDNASARSVAYQRRREHRVAVCLQHALPHPLRWIGTQRVRADGYLDCVRLRRPAGRAFHAAS